MKASFVLAVAAVAAVSLGAGTAFAGKGRPTATKSSLSVPEGSLDVNAKGVVDTKFFPAVGSRAERSWLRFRLGRLDGTDYTIWMDDPSTPEVVLFEVAAVTANDRGGVNFRLDTHDGATLPFGATLATLAGMAVEVHDVAGGVVLSGAVATPPAPKPPRGHGNGRD